MKEKDLLTVVKEQLTQCAGFDHDEIAKQREEALNYYFQRPRGDEIAGRSQVVSGDVSAMVEANLATMLDAFTTDKIVEFEPDGKEDETQAQLESDVVTHFVMKANNGYWEMATAIKDGLLMRTAIMKVHADDRRVTRIERYNNVEPEAYAELVNRPGIECEVLEYENKRLRLRCTYNVRRLRVEAVPPENFLYFDNWDSIDLQEIPICAERHIDSRDTLRKMFPDAASKIDKLEAMHRESQDSTGDARNPKRQPNQDWHHGDPSQDRIEWFECYVLVDKDGDGEAERRKVIIAQDDILDDEEVELVPYAAGNAFINPHRFLGVSLYDKLRQTQDINTGLNRALLDNINAANKNRLAYLQGKVSQDDLESGMVNSNVAVRGTDDVNRALAAFGVPDLSAGILANIEHQNRVRSELGGAALELASGNAQLASERVGSQGLDRAYSVMEQLAAMMTKNMAQSLLRNLFLLAHATMRRYFEEATAIKVNGDWMSPVPSEWPERQSVTVKVGMSVGERRRKLDALTFILDKQIQMAEAGEEGTLVTIKGFHRALLDWSRVAEVDNPEQYWVDPESEDAQRAAQSKAQRAQQAEAQRQQLMQLAVGLEQLKIAMQKRDGDLDRQFQYWEALLKGEIEEAKIVGSAVTDLEARRVEANKQAKADQAGQGPSGERNSTGDSGAAAG